MNVPRVLGIIIIIMAIVYTPAPPPPTYIIVMHDEVRILLSPAPRGLAANATGSDKNMILKPHAHKYSVVRCDDDATV